MRTPPHDLEDEAISTALGDRWGITATVEYRPLGFGSHHWRVTAPSGASWFATVDDLDAKRRSPADSADAAFARLTGVFEAVHALHEVAGLHFVVAPIRDRHGDVLVRLDQRYALVLHPFLDGHNPGRDGVYARAADRSAVVRLVVELHAATEVAAPHVEVDALALPHGDDIADALDHLGTTWDAGPYAERARALLAANGAGLRRLLDAHQRLAAVVGQRTDRLVLTHGEPHADNVYVVGGAHRLLDWETAFVAAPERDLWVLDPGDGSVIEQYRQATGVVAMADALDLYRLTYDLDEIGGYLQRFRSPHRDDADSAQSWLNLTEFLQPAARWPALVG